MKKISVLAVGLAMVVVAVTVRADQSTVKDGVYTKAQADGAKELWGTACARCHTLGDLSTAPADKGPVLSGDAFLTKWNGKTLFELADGIQKNMPNDFSMELTAQQAADVTALILQVNGLPAGTKALPPGDALKQVTIVK